MKVFALVLGLSMLVAGCSGNQPTKGAAQSPGHGASPAPSLPTGQATSGATIPSGAGQNLAGDRYAALGTALHRRGVAIWWEADLVSRWQQGQASFNQAITRLGELAKVPGTVGFKISDEIGYNDGLTSEAEATQFLTQSREQLAKVAPGKQILVDAVVPELGCLPWRGGNQQGCAQRVRTKYPAASAAAVESYLRAHLIDRLDLSTGLLDASTYAQWGLTPLQAQTDAWQRVEAQGWGTLTILQARKALADADGYQGDAAQGALDAKTYVDVPVGAGAKGVDIWTWRQHYKGQVYSLLAPDLSTNPLWTELTQRHQQGIQLYTHMTPSMMPTDSSGFDHECDLAASVFSNIFVAAGTG